MAFGKIYVDEVIDSNGDTLDISELTSNEATNAAKGYLSAADKAKLDGVETAATADQTKADIDALNIDADTLDGQHGSYYTGYTDTAVAGLVDSSPATLDTLNELAAALGDDPNFATTTANSIGTKLSKSGGQMTGNITFSGSQTVDGRDLSVDGTKLDGIAAGAQVNAVTSVNGSTGAVTVQGFSGDYDDLTNKPTLGTAAATASTAYATAAQGALADSATQPGDLSTVATSGSYNDLSNKPTLGSAAATASTAYATAAQGTTADSALQPGDPNPVMVSTTGSLPSASSNHGAVVHVHGEGAMYFAHSGAWVKLQNASINGLPELP
jgi:hypothetical protein